MAFSVVLAIVGNLKTNTVRVREKCCGVVWRVLRCTSVYEIHRDGEEVKKLDWGVGDTPLLREPVKLVYILANCGITSSISIR
jgi:hypothetical protein